MPNNLEDLLTEQYKAFEQFKTYVEREMKEIRTGGVAQPETKAAIDNLNRRMDDLQALMQRPAPFPPLDQERKAFVQYLRKGWAALNPEQQTKAMAVGSDPTGGYLVLPDTSGPLVQKLYDTTPMRRVAGIQRVSDSDALEGPVDRDEFSAGWTGETTTRTETTAATVAGYRIPAHECYAEPRTTQKLLDDAAWDVEQWLLDKIADKLSRVQNAAFATGTGVSSPRGITTYPTAATADSARAWGTLEHVATGASGAWGSTNPADTLFDVVYALKAGYRAGAVWLMPKAALAGIRKFKEATTNAYLWQPGLQAGEPSRLLGYPLIEAEDMPSIAANSLSVAFGNFRIGYLIVDRSGIRVLRDPFTAKPYVKFYSTARVGGDVVNFEAIKLIKFST